jgi:hypothetical protein
MFFDMNSLSSAPLLVLGFAMLLVAFFRYSRRSAPSAPDILQNENQSPVTKPRKVKGLIITGILLLAVGIIFLNELWVGEQYRSWIGHKAGALLLLGPVMVVLGAVMLLAALFRYVGRFVHISSVPGISPYQTARFEKAWRVFIWIVAVSTIFPFWWMDILVWSSGGRPGNEGEGMSGFLITIFFGLPALAVALHNEIRLRKNRAKK